MTRRRALVLAGAAILSPLLITAVIVAAVRSADKHHDAKPGPVRPTSFNSDTLPVVHLDACPRGSDLLPTAATGKELLPDVTLECIGAHGSTDTLALRRLGGVPTVVNLWQTNCIPCRQEMPILQQLYASAAGRIRLLGVNSKDDSGAARATINNTGIHYPNVADPHDQVMIGIGAFGRPVTIFVAADGRVVHVKLGAYPSLQALKDDVAKHLGVQL